MNGNSSLSREGSARADRRHPLPRWRRVFIALMLALSIGSGGQLPRVQAAPARDQGNASMIVINPKLSFCVGQSAFYEVKVFINFKADALSGISVDAESVDQSVGDFIGPNKKGLFTHRTKSWEELDNLRDHEDMPSSAVFQFKAKKVGTTTLYFQGLAYGQYASFNVPVRVIPCRYRVVTHSTWSAGMTSVATIYNAVLEANDYGEFKPADVAVLWNIPNLCGNAIKSPVFQSMATLSGRLNENDQLQLKITFTNAGSEGGGNCGGFGVHTANNMTPDPLYVTLSSSGGVESQVHIVKAENGDFPGSVIIMAWPEEEK